MNSQPSFEFFEALDTIERDKPKTHHLPKISRAQYDVHLGFVLHQLQVSHPLYTLLIAIAYHKVTQGLPITVAGLSAATGKDYCSLMDHISARPARVKSGKGNPHLFILDRSGPLNTVDLSGEGVALLAKVRSTVNRYAEQQRIRENLTR